MDRDRYDELVKKLRTANADAHRVDGLRMAGDDVLESVASCLDKLVDVNRALLEELAPSKHAQAVDDAIRNSGRDTINPADPRD